MASASYKANTIPGRKTVLQKGAGVVPSTGILCMKKSIFLLWLLLLGAPAGIFAQRKVMNMAEHDNKPYYFGLTFGFNMSQYRITYDPSFANTDTFMRIEPYWSPGFSLGLMGNLRMSERFDLRFIPAISFAGKRIQYNEPQKPSVIEDKTTESVYLTLPLQLKFKSDRLHNFRFYALGGGKFDVDLAANSRSRRRDEYLKVLPIDAGFEIGFGFEWYYPNFIFSPEIKLSQGLMNQLYRGDRNLPLSNALEGLNTRSIVISIHLEG